MLKIMSPPSTPKKKKKKKKNVGESCLAFPKAEK